MNKHLKINPWKIIEESFCPERMRASESIFSIGNGTMGGRANFEETYSGDTLQGNYIGGIYYPDKTRVGWWKNGYPEYFAKVLNSAFWPGINIVVNGTELDLNRITITDFYRELNMQEGTLLRRFQAILSDGTAVAVESLRFTSLKRTELGALRYSITPLNREAEIKITSYIEANVKNEDANYNEKFWEKVSQERHAITMRTQKSGFEVCWHMKNRIIPESPFSDCSREECPKEQTIVNLQPGETATLYKYAGITSSLNHPSEGLSSSAAHVAQDAAATGFDALLQEQKKAWQEKWALCDIEIEGDEESQQGIRYCIFQLLQTYTGTDNRLNIGPKGFTGEKYGGSTYWDTEAYCIPFYLSTAGQEVARQLLIYRYNQLDKAIENAVKLGFSGGAALYPMVTMNGEECHNEWEITFEEIHRNGTIAFAIYNYIRYTGDNEYLSRYGLEVLIGIARFWAQRITFSEQRQQYVLLGVTGPNEYENNVNNNWYTSYIAAWCMNYAAESANRVSQENPEAYLRITAKTGFDREKETALWKRITDNLYLGEDKELGIFLQQDGYLDKEQILAKDLPLSQRPINQKWSWDRILRSCFIKQADVLQGLYFFEDHFDTETIARNFYFYEPRTVHESSLSPCVHAIIAARIGDNDKALEMYLRTSRLDLDDYNKEVQEGLHITSMAGSWLAAVQGFGGMRVCNGVLIFNPHIPQKWRSMSFHIVFRGSVLNVRFSSREAVIQVISGNPVPVEINGTRIEADTIATKITF